MVLEYFRDLWTQEQIDEKLTINPQYVTPETGLVPQVGVEKTQEESEDIQYKPIFGQFGQGSLFAIGGAAESVGVREESTSVSGPPLSVALFTLFTSAAGIGNTYRFCWSWDAFGNLPLVSGAAESVTFDYNEDTVVTFTTDDNGLITATGYIVDHGSISNPLTAGIQNNGSILNTFTVCCVTCSLFADCGAAESTTTNPPVFINLHALYKSIGNTGYP